MKAAQDWKDYEIIASGGGEKLERWGPVYLLRPDPQAIWRPKFDLSGFEKLDAKYSRSSSGGGSWAGADTRGGKLDIPFEWVIGYKGLKFLISPTNFKHTGLFPEQAVNWDIIGELVRGAVNRIGEDSVSVLNLFGYTGGATVACAVAGANIVHVDASKGMVDVCKRNCKLNDLPDTRVRFIVDDCIKFVQREIRRGKKYDAVIMDPPSFGRGANGEVWKIEESLDYLVSKCCELLSDKPLFFLINSYTAGLQPTVIKNVLSVNLKLKENDGVIDGRNGWLIESYEIGLPTAEGIVLPAGCSALATFMLGGGMR